VTAQVTCAAFGWFASLAGVRALTLPDEARYTAVAWEMLRSGDWWTPTLNGLPFLHKPLFYWMTAASLASFGGLQWSARFASMAGATLACLSVWMLARRRSGDRVARWTVLSLATCPLFFAAAQIASPDMLVTGCITCAVCCSAEAALRGVAGERH
jgi:4-amino-4-deoxy-L-arabinose transferase-like glycosyltransferase